MLLQHNSARTILKAFTLKRSNFSPPVSSYIENKPASHHPPAASNIQLPRGIQCYWETMTMSTTSTVMQRVCVCPCDGCFIQEVPWPFYYTAHTRANSFSFSHSHPLNPTHTHTKSSSASQYVPGRNKHMAQSFLLLPKKMHSCYL